MAMSSAAADARAGTNVWPQRAHHERFCRGIAGHCPTSRRLSVMGGAVPGQPVLEDLCQQCLRRGFILAPAAGVQVNADVLPKRG